MRSRPSQVLLAPGRQACAPQKRRAERSTPWPLHRPRARRRAAAPESPRRDDSCTPPTVRPVFVPLLFYLGISSLRSRGRRLARPPLIGSHQAPFRENVSFRRALELLATGAGLKFEFDVERVKAEEIAMRFARWRTRSVKADVFEIITSLHGAAF